MQSSSCSSQVLVSQEPWKTSHRMKEGEDEDQDDGSEHEKDESEN